jgi:hypothetical protein
MPVKARLKPNPSSGFDQSENDAARTVERAGRDALAGWGKHGCPAAVWFAGEAAGICFAPEPALRERFEREIEGIKV